MDLRLKCQASVAPNPGPRRLIRESANVWPWSAMQDQRTHRRPWDPCMGAPGRGLEGISMAPRYGEPCQMIDLGAMERPGKPFVGIHPYWDCTGSTGSLHRIAGFKSNFIMCRKLQYTKNIIWRPQHGNPNPAVSPMSRPVFSTRRRRTTTAHRAMLSC